MKAILTKLFASILSAGLAAFALPATQRTGDDAEVKLHASHAGRQHPKKVDDIKVNCSDPKNIQPLSALLAKLDPNHPHTLRVSGACQDNVSIVSFTDLTLIAEPGASITDASGGLLPVVNVGRTTAFEMQGFTISGQAVLCGDYSTCFFSGNTFQDSADDGVTVSQSRADFIGDIMQHNLNAGIRAIYGSVVALDSASLSDNFLGAFVSYGSVMVGFNVAAQQNGTQGLRISTHSILRLDGSDASNNGSDGIFVQIGSDGYFNGNTIHSNGQAGVRVRDLSMVVFPGGSDVTGNLGGTDVVCEGQFSAARDASTSINGGTTNCTPE